MSGRGRVWARMMAALLVVAPVSSALACPDLGGTFECPAAGNQAAMTLVVTSHPGIDDGASYVFTYKIMGKEISSQVLASPKGLPSSNGQINSCSNTAYIRKAASGAETTETFINAAGNYETTKGGKTQMVCVRKGS